jgi:hypothetical protein
MNLFKTCLTLTILGLFTISAAAQSYKPPKNYKLKKKSDYAEYEDEVLDAVNWLESTPVNQDVEKRQAASVFLIQWMTGAPDVTIELQAYVMPLTKKNEELLITFMGAWTRFALENPDEADDNFKANYAGLESMIKVYQMNRKYGFKKNGKLEKLVAMSTTERKAWLKAKMG